MQDLPDQLKAAQEHPQVAQESGICASPVFNTKALTPGTFVKVRHDRHRSYADLGFMPGFVTSASLLSVDVQVLSTPRDDKPCVKSLTITIDDIRTDKVVIHFGKDIKNAQIISDEAVRNI